MSEFVIREKLKKLLVGSSKAREVLNVKPHFTPISVEALRISLLNRLGNTKEQRTEEANMEMIKSINSMLVEALTNKDNSLGSTLTSNTLIARNGSLYNSKNEEITAENIKGNTPAIVYSNNVLVGVLASTIAGTTAYDYIKNKILGNILNKQKFTKYLDKSKYGNRKIGFDVGHVIMDESRLATAAAISQVDMTLEKMVSISGSIKDPAQKYTLDTIKNKIQHERDTFVQKTAIHGTSLEKLSFFKEFGPGMLKLGVNVVLFQDRQQNQGEFGPLEKGLINLVKDDLLNLHFSRNALEEVAEQVAISLLGKKIPKTRATLAVPTDKSKSTKVRVDAIPPAGRLRDPSTGRFVKTNTANLMAILNFHLHDVVAANMGDGNRRDILNYRTGRLATSTEVKRVTMQRDGAVAAYYTYMKNPYATFSEGGRQEFPRSRDPKLLISKSIREIGATLVGNRMRAILV